MNKIDEIMAEIELHIVEQIENPDIMTHTTLRHIRSELEKHLATNKE